MKIIKYFSLLVALIFYGCGAGQIAIKQPQQKNPIQVGNENLPKISVAKINSSLLPGQVIGGHFDGLAQVKQQNYYAQGVVSSEWEEKYKEIIYSELSNAGYSVPSYSKLFGEKDNYNIRFLLGGSITNSALQSFGSLAGNYTEDFIEVEWELFDKELNKSIFKSKTQGYSKLDGVTIEAPSFALRNCVRNLLAESSFVEALQKQKSNSTQPSLTMKVSYYNTNNNYDESKNNLDKYLDAIFAVKTENGHGSGFIINPDGYAITNNHVIENRNFFDAIFADGKTIRVNVIATFPDKDIALLKLTGSNYSYLPLANKDEIKVGEDVFAVGTPIALGLSQSVSKGIISGVRETGKIHLIQTDASVNPGNSGGPLILKNGKVVGVVSMKLSAIGIEGLGFAISADEIISTFNLERK